MKPQNIIIAIVFLLIISVFSFNFEGITGLQISNDLLKRPEVNIVNDVVKAGFPMQVKVKINEYCVDPKVEFYYKGTRKSHTTFKPTIDECADKSVYSCRGIKYCKGDLKDDTLALNFYTLPSWKVNPGVYKVRIIYFEKPGQKQNDAPYLEAPFKITS